MKSIVPYSFNVIYSYKDNSEVSKGYYDAMPLINSIDYTYNQT